MTVSEEFVEFLADGAVAIEVYGHKQANHRRNLALWDLGVIQAKTRSLRERCSDTNTHTIMKSSELIQNTRDTQRDGEIHLLHLPKLYATHYQLSRCYNRTFYSEVKKWCVHAVSAGGAR